MITIVVSPANVVRQPRRMVTLLSHARRQSALIFPLLRQYLGLDDMVSNPLWGLKKIRAHLYDSRSFSTAHPCPANGIPKLRLMIDQ